MTAVPYLMGALICHQRPDRSFFTGGTQWPVCARCAGLYLSAALGVMLGLAVPRRMPSPLERARPWRVALLAAGAPTVAGWLLEHTGGWAIGSAARAALAVPLGAALGALLVAVAWHATGRVENLE